MNKRVLGMLKKSTQDYSPDHTRVVKSVDSSREGLIVPELIFTYGNRKNHMKKFPKVARFLIPAIIKRQRGYRSLRNNPKEPKRKADALFLKNLQDYAESLGCGNVGFVQVPNELIFKDKSILYSHAMVLTMPMDKGKMSHAPKMDAGKEVWRVYDGLGGASNKIAQYLRKHGYGAQAGAALGGDTNYPLLAQLAGLGWIGHHGLLISPDVGPSQRIAVVYLSIENLPAPKENQYRWIGEFCKKCNKCVRSCPGGAIFQDKPQQSDGSPKHIDSTKCAIPFSNTMGCSICIKECLFFQRDLNAIKSTYMRNIGDV